LYYEVGDDGGSNQSSDWDSYVAPDWSFGSINAFVETRYYQFMLEFFALRGGTAAKKYRHEAVTIEVVGAVPLPPRPQTRKEAKTADSNGRLPTNFACSKETAPLEVVQ
jgi:hypothetical protein